MINDFKIKKVRNQSIKVNLKLDEFLAEIEFFNIKEISVFNNLVTIKSLKISTLSFSSEELAYNFYSKAVKILIGYKVSGNLFRFYP